MSKRTKVTFSVVLVICLLLTGLPSAVPVAAAKVDEPLNNTITESTATEPQTVTKQIAVTEEIPVLQLDADCQILNHVDPEVFAAGNHIARLPEQETLSSYVFLNADGTQTVYYMDQPVKFEQADGTVVEKNLTLTTATEGYTTTQNDIQLTIPTNPTNGIRLVYDNHQITLIPQGGILTNAAQATDSSVTYPDYYGEGMSLRYTPTLSGVKEDILLDTYSGVNSFTFRLNTGGLNLYQANGRYYLAESKVATDRIELGEVVSYDAKSKFSVGTMTAQTIMAGQAYLLTLTVDEAFLTDESTTYPVTIDPTLTVSYGNNGDNYIIDAPIFEGYPNKNYGAFQYNRVGYVDSSYQSGRTVVKLPVLTSSSIYTSLTADNITSVTFHVKEATGSNGISVSLYPLTANSTWTETSVTWNNAGSKASTATDTKTLTDSAWSVFDITALVKQWKNGTYSANCGFIMIGANENSLDKSFCSSEHEKTSYRPYVVMTYELPDPDPDPDPDPVPDPDPDPIPIPDGVYRIKSSCGLYLGTYGSIAENTSVRLLAYSDEGLSKIQQLWKIAYIGSGYYSIRPMHKLDMGLHTTSNNVDITTTAGPNNTLNDVVSYHRWGISSTGTEGVYYINNIGTSSMAMRYANGITSPGLGVITASNNGSSSTFRWSLEAIDDLESRLLLYDEDKGVLSTNIARKIIVNESYSVDDLDIGTSVVTIDGNNQGITWISLNPQIASVNANTGEVQGHISGQNTTIKGTIEGEGEYCTVAYTVSVCESIQTIFHAIPDSGHDHLSKLQEAKNELATVKLTQTTIKATSLSASTCKSDIKSARIFTSRSHGLQVPLEGEYVSATGIMVSNSVYLENASIFFSNPLNNMSSNWSAIESEDDFSNLDVALFVGCSTAAGGAGGNNLPTKIVAKGCKVAIGFTESINCGSANTWVDVFYEKFTNGSTVAEAANQATQAAQSSTSGISEDTVVIVGNSSLRLEDLMH